MAKTKEVSFHAQLSEVRHKGVTDKQDARQHIVTHLPLQAEVELAVRNALTEYAGQTVHVTIGPAQGDLEL